MKGALVLPLVAAGCATTSAAGQASGRAPLDDVVSIDVQARGLSGGTGVLGAWPISIRPAGFSTFIDHIKRMIDTVGVEHVAIGTDMAGVNPRSALFTDWAEWPSIPSALLDRGFARQDVVRIMGGNVQRLLETTLG